LFREAPDRVSVLDVKLCGLHPWIRRNRLVEQLLAAARNDDLVPLSMKSLRKGAANTGASACDQNGVAIYLHDVFSSLG
jgi:hypothetical protein